MRGRGYIHRAVKDVSSEEIFEKKKLKEIREEVIVGLDDDQSGRGKSDYKGRESMPCLRKNKNVRPKAVRWMSLGR